MLRAHFLATATGLLALSLGSLAAAQDDIAEVASKDLNAGGDAMKRYFLIGSPEGKAPPGGYALLVVLPGGDASAEFNPFVKRIFENVLDSRWLMAELVAPEWNAQQFERVVWPTTKLRYPAAKFTTEEFIEAVIADVQTKTKLDPKRIFLLGWSSGGPPCYAAALRKNTPVTGAFVAMSVFKPSQLPTLDNAAGRAFYLLQSPDDEVTPFRFAETAEKSLSAGGAQVKLERYPGGHGWRGDVYGMLRSGIEWLDKQAE